MEVTTGDRAPAPRSTAVVGAGSARSTAVDRGIDDGSTAVDQALVLLRRAVADRGYTLDALSAAMGKDRAHIHRVLQGEKPLTLQFITALPDDLEARYEQLRAEAFGFIVVTPLEGPDAVKGFVGGLMGLLNRGIA